MREVSFLNGGDGESSRQPTRSGPRPSSLSLARSLALRLCRAAAMLAAAHSPPDAKSWQSPEPREGRPLSRTGAGQLGSRALSRRPFVVEQRVTGEATVYGGRAGPVPARHANALPFRKPPHPTERVAAAAPHSVSDDLFADPRTGVALAVSKSRHVRSRCRCSVCPAIHINSRSWLRSSSTHEPSDPPPRAVIEFEQSSTTRATRAERLRPGFPEGTSRALCVQSSTKDGRPDRPPSGSSVSFFYSFVHSVRNNVNGGDRPWQRTSSPGCPALSSPGNGVSAPPQSRLLYCRIRAPVRRALSEVPPASPLNGPTARFMAHDRAVRSPPVGPDLRTNKGPSVAAESPAAHTGSPQALPTYF